MASVSVLRQTSYCLTIMLTGMKACEITRRNYRDTGWKSNRILVVRRRWDAHHSSVHCFLCPMDSHSEPDAPVACRRRLPVVAKDNTWGNSDVILLTVVTPSMLEVGYRPTTSQQCNVVNLCIPAHSWIRGQRITWAWVLIFPRFNSLFFFTLSIPPTWRRGFILSSVALLHRMYNTLENEKNENWLRRIQQSDAALSCTASNKLARLGLYKVQVGLLCNPKRRVHCSDASNIWKQTCRTSEHQNTSTATATSAGMTDGIANRTDAEQCPDEQQCRADDSQRPAGGPHRIDALVERCQVTSAIIFCAFPRWCHFTYASSTNIHHFVRPSFSTQQAAKHSFLQALTRNIETQNVKYDTNKKH